MAVWEKTVLIVCSLILIVFLFVIIFREHGLVQLTVRQGEMKVAESQNAVLKKKNDNLCREIQRLKSDSDYIENVARKDLGMIREDEIIIRFPDKKKQKGE